MGPDPEGPKTSGSPTLLLCIEFCRFLRQSSCPNLVSNLELHAVLAVGDPEADPDPQDFLGLLDPDPLVRCADPDPSLFS
jgi:hypothetical protein